jgi:hypothetical protein
MWNRNRPVASLLHCSIKSSIVGACRGETDGITWVEDSGCFILQEDEGREEAGRCGWHEAVVAVDGLDVSPLNKEEKTDVDVDNVHVQRIVFNDL